MIDYGVETITINIKNKGDYIALGKTGKGFKNIIKTLMPIHLLDLCNAFKRRLLTCKLSNIRGKNFCRFDKQYIEMKTYFANRYKQLYHNKDLRKYDFFLVGSDQVWNPD